MSIIERNIKISVSIFKAVTIKPDFNSVSLNEHAQFGIWGFIDRTKVYKPIFFYFSASIGACCNVRYNKINIVKPW